MPTEHRWDGSRHTMKLSDGRWYEAGTFTGLLAERNDGPDTFEDATGAIFAVHERRMCSSVGEIDRPCVLHRPSDHHMSSWPTIMRVGGLIERQCEHGIGHPDPDSVAYYARTSPGMAAGVHGCDGCCVTPLQRLMQEPSVIKKAAEGYARVPVTFGFPKSALSVTFPPFTLSGDQKMPYVDQTTRKSVGKHPLNSGELAYKLMKVVLRYVKDNSLCFQSISDVDGALKAVSREFDRRVANPYEDAKIEINGDLKGFEWVAERLLDLTNPVVQPPGEDETACTLENCLICDPDDEPQGVDENQAYGGPRG